MASVLVEEFNSRVYATQKAIKQNYKNTRT